MANNKTKIFISILVIIYLCISMIITTGNDYTKMGHKEILESLRRGASESYQPVQYVFDIQYKSGTSGIVPKKEEVKAVAVKKVEEQINAITPPRGVKFTDKVVKRRVTKQDKRNYVAKYKNLAIQHMHKHKIPASITLAQGILESNAGFSKLAVYNNNHFGIKCFSRTCKRGHCSNYTDDSHKDFFRVYNSVSGSYESHSQLLKKSRYKPLFKLEITDYKGWAHGLKKAGYATDKNYGPKLIKLIEDYKLYQYDKQ
jgi:flagellum-specific peptidoglycan hydrolase FlgJ